MLATSQCGHIHSLILKHFCEGAGAAAYLRGRIPGFADILSRFFASRSDINRIQQAQMVSERILSLTDFTDMIPLRSEVATLEIKRLVDYKSQTDHTAHTVYLFLLGIWVYDNLPIISSEIDKSIGSVKPIKMFIFQWTFASLLHDVGYLFYNFEKGHNADSWFVYDEMFTLSFIRKHAGEINDIARKELDQTWGAFCTSFGIPGQTKKSKSKQLIEQLENIPWLADLLPDYQSGLITMNSVTVSEPRLQTYAMQMAISGYDGTPVVDHGIASGLMLLKYTSMWYWLSSHAANSQPQLFKEMNDKNGYYPKVFHKHVIPACRAVSYHNIPGIVFELDKEPLLYLSVLCDELQIWDRFLSGYQHIDNWKTIEHCMAEDIGAEIVCGESGSPLLHLMTSDSHFKKLHSSLDKRVKEWRRFVQLTRI